MKSLNQLLLDFDYEQNFKDDDFYVGKSNFYAFEMINKWPKWEKNFLNINGEKFSGKTHLVNIFLKKFNGIRIDINSKKTEKIIKLEKALGSLDLVSDFNILNFNSENIQYKITYNGTPNIFLNDMRKKNLELQMINNIWTIK